ncbi:hypothetical protein [Escherichia coli]|uniref:hypothetical protein n=1 Tax=Escherichia coli TaxID=562 RepID=UPI00226F8EF6|nr:hypothetical protein [Escherichia coli]
MAVIFYRSARDGYGFEADCSNFTCHQEAFQQEMFALPYPGGQLNGATGYRGTSSALAVIRLYWVIMTGFKQNGDGNLDVMANNVPCYALLSRKAFKL